MARWLFSRDVNITFDNVFPFLKDPSIVESAKNPAARPSAFQDWGLWVIETRSPTEIGQALLEERINWQECILLLLSKRAAETDVDSSVKPLVVICKAITYMLQSNVRTLSKPACAKYLIPIDNYDDIEGAVGEMLADTNPAAENSYLDIWFNALVESRLFIYPARKKDVIELAQTAYAEGISKFIALYGDRMEGTPSKANNKTEYYNYLGSMETGLAELLSPIRSMARAFPHLAGATGENHTKVTGHGDSQDLNPFLTAIRTKPFLLLAGISGTGKSRLVRQLARATAPDALRGEMKPGNYELIPVKPNWHDSTELLGYVSRISGEPEYVMTDFVRFLFKAMLYPETPFFLCLDEMNLAPVEQYFAEYLSVIETRAKTGDGTVATDVLVGFETEIYEKSVKGQLETYCKTLGKENAFAAANEEIRQDGGLRIPPNLVVIGTVNMDETTFSFSRKVLDRAMSFELNAVDMNEGVKEDNSTISPIPPAAVTPKLLSANEAYTASQAVADMVLERLTRINAALDGTPFKIAYRSRNEIMIYVYERLRDSIAMNNPDGNSIKSSGLFHQAMDEAVSMKILSRIEGDEQRIHPDFLTSLETAIKGDVTLEAEETENADSGQEMQDGAEPQTDAVLYPVCCAKLKQMREQLKHGYVSFWS